MRGRGPQAIEVRATPAGRLCDDLGLFLQGQSAAVLWVMPLDHMAESCKGRGIGTDDGNVRLHLGRGDGFAVTQGSQGCGLFPFGHAKDHAIAVRPFGCVEGEDKAGRFCTAAMVDEAHAEPAVPAGGAGDAMRCQRGSPDPSAASRSQKPRAPAC